MRGKEFLFFLFYWAIRAHSFPMKLVFSPSVLQEGKVLCSAIFSRRAVRAFSGYLFLGKFFVFYASEPSTFCSGFFLILSRFFLPEVDRLQMIRDLAMVAFSVGPAVGCLVSVLRECLGFQDLFSCSSLPLWSSGFFSATIAE